MTTLAADDRPRCAWQGTTPRVPALPRRGVGASAARRPGAVREAVAGGFQAGLSWITILRKRPRFREVFAGFDPEIVAEFGDDDIARLMADPGIIRNRAKIEATIGNAALVREMADGELDALMWSFAPSAPAARPRSMAEVPPAVTPESEAMSRALRKRGLRFVGPTTMYALMQSAGMVDDHVAGCWRAG